MAGADEPLSSNELVNRLRALASRCFDYGWITEQEHADAGADAIERLTRENESLGEQVLAERRMEREVEKLRHELDNERAAMRNVQECAESYRRACDVGVRAYKKLHAENERLRAALERIEGIVWEPKQQRNREVQIDNISVITDEALRPAKETPHRIDKLGDCRNPGCVYPAVGYTDRSKCPIGPAFETKETYPLDRDECARLGKDHK